MNGVGIIKGLIETARNLAGSYHDKERLTTVQYPEENLPPVENARTIPFLVYDGGEAEAGLRCTACTICERSARRSAFTLSRTWPRSRITWAKCNCIPRCLTLIFPCA